MDWFNIECPACGYQAQIVVGTPSPNESFDLNEDFSQYVPMLCNACNSVVSVDLYNEGSKTECPCGSPGKIMSEEELKKLDCPNCGNKNLKIEKKDS